MAIFHRELPPTPLATITSLADDPGFTAAAVKLASLQADRAAIEAEIAELWRQVRAGSERDVETAAAQLLAGQVVELDALADLRLGKLQDRLRVLARAIELQRDVVEMARRKASPAIVEAARPAYVAVVQRMAEALLGLAAAVQDEEKVREGLRAEGIAFAHALRPMPFPIVEDPRSSSAPLALWFREAVQYGLLEATAVPAGLRALWGIRP